MELEKTIYAIIGGFITLLLATIVKWINDKRDIKRIKTAEYFSSLSKYVDYLISLTFYPKKHIDANYEKMLLKLELLKSQFIESQCLLVAYNYKIFLNTKSLVKEVIQIDGEFTEFFYQS